MKKTVILFVVFMLNNFLFSQETLKTNNIRTNVHSSSGTLKSKNKPPVNNIFTDARDGQVYKIVKIGTQVWMAENLRTTHYNNGSTIPNVTSNTTWSSVTNGVWCSYENSTSNDTKYGKLYNCYAVNTGLLAPKGWHVPTEAEWSTLIDYLTITLGKTKFVGKALASKTEWKTVLRESAIGNDLEKNNSTGFNALPGGARNYQGIFHSINELAGWWTFTTTDNNSEGTKSGWSRDLNYQSGDVGWQDSDKQCGFYIRCIKDTQINKK